MHRGRLAHRQRGLAHRQRGIEPVGDVRQRAAAARRTAKRCTSAWRATRCGRPGSAASSASAVFARRWPARSPWCNGRPAPRVEPWVV